MLYKYNKNTLQYVKFNFNFELLKIILFFAIPFTFLGLISFPPEKEYITTTEEVMLVSSSNEFSEEKLITLLKELNLPYPHITLAQAKLESGRYSSRIFKENHNLFGMKEARVRVNLAQGTQYGHAYYDSWEDSVLDYAFWYSCYARKCKSEKELFQLLSNQYAESPGYVSSLKRIISKQQLTKKF